MTAAEMVQKVIAELAPSARAEISAIEIRVEGRPSEVDLGRGCRPDQAGYFYGTRPTDDDGDEGTLPDPAPATGEIVLFAQNIVPLTAEKFRRVLLHEIAHALGCDEDDMQILGLSA